MLPLWKFSHLQVSRAPTEGARKLTAGPCCSSGKKGTLAAIPGTPVNKSEFSATSCLPFCSRTSSAVAKLSVCWAGSGTGAGVINPLNVLHPGVHPEKPGSKMALVVGGMEGFWPDCPRQGGWINQGRAVDRLEREQLFPRIGVSDAGLQPVGTGSVAI